MTCELENVRILCSGPILGNLCLAHQTIFDIWGCNGGYEIYSKDGDVAGREVFRKWFDGLSSVEIELIRNHG